MDKTPDWNNNPNMEPSISDNGMSQEVTAAWQENSSSNPSAASQTPPVPVEDYRYKYSVWESKDPVSAPSNNPIGKPCPPMPPAASVPPVYTPSMDVGNRYSYGTSYEAGPAYSVPPTGYVSPIYGQVPPVGQVPSPGPYPSSGQYPPTYPVPPVSQSPYGAPYGGAWSAPPPPVEVAEPDDPTKLRILVSGRTLFPQEYAGLRKITAGGGRMMVLLFAALALLFGWMAFSAAVSNASVDVVVATLILLGGSLLFLLIDLLLYSGRFHRKCEAEYATLCYNPNNPAPISISEFYDDRVVVTTARGSSVVPYSRVTAYMETAGQMALFVDRDFVCWRGADLTPYDAQLIREHLRRHVRPSLVRIKHEVVPCLREPLPIPDLKNDDQLVVRAQIVDGVQEEWHRRMHGLLGQLPELLPMLLVLATATAEYWILSNWFLLDVLAFFGAYLVGGALLAVLLLFLGVRSVLKKDAVERVYDLAFTRDGLAIRRNGFTKFVEKQRIRIVPSSEGVRLEMPSETLFVPWTAAENPERLKALLNL